MTDNQLRIVVERIEGGTVTVRVDGVYPDAYGVNLREGDSLTFVAGTQMILSSPRPAVGKTPTPGDHP